MGNNKIVFAGLAGGVTLFLLGWLVYGMLLMDFMAANVGSATGVNKTEAEMSLLWIFIGNLSTGFVLALIFGKYGNIKDAMAGASAGALLGLLLSIGFHGIMYGTTNIMNMTGMGVDVVVSTIMMAITGAVVASVLGMNKKAA